METLNLANKAATTSIADIDVLDLTLADRTIPVSAVLWGNVAHHGFELYNNNAVTLLHFIDFHIKHVQNNINGDGSSLALLCSLRGFASMATTDDLCLNLFETLEVSCRLARFPMTNFTGIHMCYDLATR